MNWWYKYLSIAALSNLVKGWLPNSYGRACPWFSKEKKGYLSKTRFLATITQKIIPAIIEQSQGLWKCKCGLRCHGQGTCVCEWRLANTGKYWLQEGSVYEQYIESIPTLRVLFISYNILWRMQVKTNLPTEILLLYHYQYTLDSFGD